MAIMYVPIYKLGETAEIDIEKLSEEVFREVVFLGCRELVNRGQSRAGNDKAKSREILIEALAAIQSGKIRYLNRPRRLGAMSGAQACEQMRKARGMVKEALKEKGIKINYVDAKEITRAARELIVAGKV